ncbi:hypothetical protein [Psychrobacter sp. FDAARGOS_221]|uniref:hypothetical protein n=1 Tax=Psychrobacter sp. FDAARGOS_221 TaxID=1975705 RepID=UPI000BB55068|nr:hypothetical protein [Psychrobacter sp. FDAARGOS_221]PNK60263.1 hypothetical protein A6J60_004860 [Psychrobacter sp. FDAARGOS_221]
MRLLLTILGMAAVTGCVTQPVSPNSQPAQASNSSVQYAKEAVIIDRITSDYSTILNTSKVEPATESPLTAEPENENENENEIYDEMFVIQDESGWPVAGYAYKIVTAEGDLYRGYTNERGETVRVTTGNRPVSLCLLRDRDRDDGRRTLIKGKTDIPCPASSE